MDDEMKTQEHFKALSAKTGYPAEYLRLEASLAFWRARLASIADGLSARDSPRRRELLPDAELPFGAIAGHFDASGRLRAGGAILGKRHETAWLLGYHGFDPGSAPRPRAWSIHGRVYIEDRGSLALLVGLLRSRGGKGLRLDLGGAVGAPSPIGHGAGNPGVGEIDSKDAFQPSPGLECPRLQS